MLTGMVEQPLPSNVEDLDLRRATLQVEQKVRALSGAGQECVRLGQGLRIRTLAGFFLALVFHAQ